MEMSNGGNDVVEERRKNRETRKARVSRSEGTTSFTPKSRFFPFAIFALASTNQFSCCFFLYAALLRIVRQSSGTIAPHSNHCKVFRDNQKAPITSQIGTTKDLPLDISHTCSPPRGNPPATNHPLLTTYISLYIRRDATFVFLSSFLLCHAVSIQSPLIQHMLSLPNIPFIHTFLLQI
jgi:hypothetical protein